MSLPPDSSLSAVLATLSPADAAALQAAQPWSPLPGPQSRAYLSPADELYYGGAAGGGKTQVLIGLALTAHRNSLLLRRRAVDAKAISKTLQGLGYGRWRFAGSGGDLLTPDGRVVEVGGCEHETDRSKYQGQPHDLKAFDELPTFTESQYTFIIGWNRPLDPRRFPRQRCRAVGAGNPPTSPEGEWVLKRWRAWLDPEAGRKAAAGELRWYTTVGGEEVECEDGRPLAHDGTTHVPRSRTFIPARLEDNPELLASGYAATLEAMPEPLRSMLRFGDMAAAREDDAWQLVPTRWVAAAVRRWADRTGGRWEPAGAVPPTRIGQDVAMGGDDQSVTARLFGATLAPLVARRGRDTPDGQSVVTMILTAGGGGDVPTNLDTIGVGKSAYDVAQMAGLKNVRAVVASAATTYTDARVRALKFMNTRAAMMWHVRSLLDPEGGPPDTRLALPPDRELAADLTAPRYALRSAGIQVESKDDIKARIGRSTDRGDAVALACWEKKPVGFASI